MRRLILIFLIAIPLHGFSQDTCFEGASGFDGHKNLTEICFLGEADAVINTYYFNNLLPNGPTTCSALARYTIIEKPIKFHVKSNGGTCENGNIFNQVEFICEQIMKNIMTCKIEEYGVSFIVSKTQKLNTGT